MTPDRARWISDQLLTQDRIPVPEVTELPPAEGAIQWRLAVALMQDRPDFENTIPAWEVE